MHAKGFKCQNCGKFVPFKAPGTHHRNHCPRCLFSLHVDKTIGDRQELCAGKMTPIGKWLKPDGEEMIIHKCEKCGLTRKNRVAGDDTFEGVAALPIIDF